MTRNTVRLVGLVSLATLLVGGSRAQATFVPAETGVEPPQAAGGAPVADAAGRRSVDEVRRLLGQGADVNASQGDGMTALHWAAAHGDVEMARVLISAGAAVGATTRLGDYTPLHVAGKSGYAAVMVALLDAGADVEARTTAGGVTPLHFAASTGSTEAIAALLDHGADPNAREWQWGQTPLMFAAAAGRRAAAALLLSRGSDPTIAARVVDIAAREAEDRADQRLRSQRMARLAALGAAEQRAPRRPDRRQGPSGVVADGQSGRPATGPEGAQAPPSTEPGATAATGATETPTGFAPQEQLRGTTEIDPLSYADLVGSHGGLTALLLAAREGHASTVQALLDGGADVNRVSAADRTSPLLLATINGYFDLALQLLERGADPRMQSDAGATPLYAALNVQWIPKSRHPQPTEYRQQEATYLEVMEALLQAGADPNVRLRKTLWFTTYNNDLLRVDRRGATPFWRAAFALDLDAMRLLVAYGADPGTPTLKGASRRRFRGAEQEDASGLPPVAIGDPAVYPIHAASGVGYGQGYAGNSHRHVPDGWLPAVKYLVEEHGADVNARDLDGYSPVHHAAARGDNALILYLVEHGADVTVVSRRGQTTVDMANGPVQRIRPFPETIELLERLGAKNNHHCVSC